MRTYTLSFSASGSALHATQSQLAPHKDVHLTVPLT